MFHEFLNAELYRKYRLSASGALLVTGYVKFVKKNKLNDSLWGLHCQVVLDGNERKPHKCVAEHCLSQF